VIESNVPNISLETLNKALKACPLQSECELQMGGATWVSLPVQALSDGTGDVIRTLENVDAATGPVQARLRHLFFAVALGSVLIVFLCSVASARTIVKPIATVVAHLRNSTWIGELPEFQSDLSSPIVEIRELAESYNWAAISIKKARESLQRAYVEFVGSLANALDARDRYTAGHSWRVSQLSCALAAALGLDPDEVERVRVGALLHDIGKIGVSDSVLQKAGRLTDEEFALVKEHPVTGLRILQGVQGFAPFLAAVELHHENWDGTGYPRGLVAKQVPVDARIIHVADAYDAMTTDRSYRPGMKHERAIQILEENAGTQFDPTVVQLLTELPREIVQGQAAPPLDVGKQEVVEVA
jgi:putative nucleotidyltransferase with HDIG domain